MDSKINNGIFLTVVLFIITTILTALTIYYNYFNVFAEDGTPVIDRYSYIKISIQLSLLTFFIGKTIGLLKVVYILKNMDNEYMSTAYLLITFCFGFLGISILYYPGLNLLGLPSDPLIGSVIIAVSFLQTLYFYLILKQTLNENIRLLLYFILLLIGFIIVFISPFLSVIFNSHSNYWE